MTEKLKVCLYGEPNRDWAPSCLPQIAQGFIDNNCILTDNAQEANFYFAADPCGYEQMYQDFIKYPKFNVMNILDLPDKSTVENFRKYFINSSRITTISKFVQKQIKDNYNSDSTVIYYPPKPVFKVRDEALNDPRRFLYIGRANSPNKRFDIAKELMEKYYSEKQLVTVGSENPNYGKYAGILDNDWLNMFYGFSDYLLFPSSFEGQGLPPIEAVIAGKFPILCNDCEASMEFLPEFCAEPTVDGLYGKIQDIENNIEYYKRVRDNYKEDYSYIMSPVEITKKIIGLYK